MDDDTLYETDEVILLEDPVLDAGDLVEDEISVHEAETEEIVLLDLLRLDLHDVTEPGDLDLL
jgi:hypothetical protein